MGIPQELDERVDALRRLVQRLSAPDLTLTEAKDLRGQLLDMLEPTAGASLPIATTAQGDPRRPERWMIDPTIRAAS